MSTDRRFALTPGVPGQMIDALPAAAPPSAVPVGLEEIYRLHGATIHRFCLSQLQDPHLAEDASSDVFAVAIGGFHRLGDENEALYWLLGIARRVVSGHRRSRLRQRRLSERAQSCAEPVPTVHERAAVREELRRVTEAMAGLGRRDRTLVGLRVAAQLSYAEIAEVMHLSEGAARVATHRALRTLRARLEGSR